MVRSVARALAAVWLMLGGGPATAAADRYAVGQVWEYKTRASDAGSLLRIQAIENGGALGPIYHIAIVGVRLPSQDYLPHLPVSRQTLDASVTRLSHARRDWPDSSEGIAAWRRDKGGVFTIAVAEIVQIIADSVGQAVPGT